MTPRAGLALPGTESSVVIETERTNAACAGCSDVPACENPIFPGQYFNTIYKQ